MATIGYCGACSDRNHTLTIGDTDCSGRSVGYIDGGGLAWESEDERNISVGAGRVIDGIRDWEDFPLSLEILVAILDEVAFHNWLRKMARKG